MKIKFFLSSVAFRASFLIIFFITFLGIPASTAYGAKKKEMLWEVDHKRSPSQETALLENEVFPAQSTRDSQDSSVADTYTSTSTSTSNSSSNSPSMPSRPPGTNDPEKRPLAKSIAPPPPITAPSLRSTQPFKVKPITVKPLKGPTGSTYDNDNKSSASFPSQKEELTLYHPDEEFEIAETTPAVKVKVGEENSKAILINFNDVRVVEFIRFISRISNKNFVFDERELDFNVSIVSEEPTTVENIMTALLQELQIHGLNMIEQGNNLIIHKNARVNSISAVVDAAEAEGQSSSQIVTQVFRLNTIDPSSILPVLKPLVSNFAQVDVLSETNHLILTDLSANVMQISKLLKTLDAPKGGLVVGQYLVKNTVLETLIALADRILRPIALDQPLTFVPHNGANSIFVISNPYIVERSLAILEHLDQTQGETGIYEPAEKKFTKKEEQPPPETAPTSGFGGKLPRGPEKEGEWEEGEQKQTQYRPRVVPGAEGTRISPSSGIWKRDAQGKWYFDSAPGAAPGGLPPGSFSKGGQWVLDNRGQWIYEGGEAPKIPEGTPPPRGQWIKDEKDQWRFEPAEKYQFPKSGLPPTGTWLYDEAGNWKFSPGVGPGATPGGLPKGGMWVMDAQGNWRVIPTTIPDGSIPEGFWRFNEKDQTWQFQPDRLTTGIGHAKLPIGFWEKDAEGNWQIKMGREKPVGSWVQNMEGEWVFAAPGEEGQNKLIEGTWLQDEQGFWLFRPSVPATTGVGKAKLPTGTWNEDLQGNWQIKMGKEKPLGAWVQGALGEWIFAAPGEEAKGNVIPGKWLQDEEGYWLFQPAQQPGSAGVGKAHLPMGLWEQDQEGSWQIKMGKEKPEGTWVRDLEGNWIFAAPGEETKGQKILGTWLQDEEGFWLFKPSSQPMNLGKGTLSLGTWEQDLKGNWQINAGKEKPEGEWYIDLQGNWFLAKPGENVQGRKVKGRWYQDEAKNWVFRPFEGEEKTPPWGTWVKDEMGKWHFVEGEGTPGGVPPVEGVWAIDENAEWRFIPKNKEDESLFPMGYWSQDEEGRWHFHEVDRSKFTQGGAPEGASWIRDAEGNWAPAPGTKGEFPEGVWSKDSEGRWFFTPGKKLNLKGGLPEMGTWVQEADGSWRFKPGTGPGATPGGMPLGGTWLQDEAGMWRYIPKEGANLPVGTMLPSMVWQQNDAGKWAYDQDYQKWFTAPGSVMAPKGFWTKDSLGRWYFQLGEGEAVSNRRLARPEQEIADLPLGHIERTRFFIYKLQYRSGDQIQNALRQIGESLRVSGTENTDLVNTINSIQWLETSNSLVFTGTPISLRKVKELVEEVDRPLRQVFIEMLFLETTIDDALEYGVSWGTKFKGENSAGAQTFVAPAFPLGGTLAAADAGVVPDATGAVNFPGAYTLGIIGRSVTHGGQFFNSIAAIVKAQHGRSTANVLMNPKILTEDNNTAELFVGINTPFQTQSISNDLGSILTTNVEFRDVGTTLKVTPLIGDNGMITLTIEQEISRDQGQTTTQGNTSQTLTPTTSRIQTRTRFHVPDGYFLIISGMIQDEDDRSRTQVPCLGGVPVLGALFSHKTVRDNKRNLVIFIRPKIVDSIDEMQYLTKRQQDILKEKNRQKGSWRFEVDEALNFFNLKNTGQNLGLSGDHPIERNEIEDEIEMGSKFEEERKVYTEHECDSYPMGPSCWDFCESSRSPDRSGRYR